jgi:predicted small metal-binding protein
MDCPFEASAAKDEELMKKIKEHAEKVHNMKQPFSEDFVAKVKNAIKE